jgi:hypothetical protein
MDNFFTIDTESAGKQVLETVYIIGTSKNIETIKSRYEFLLSRIETLKQGQRNPQYSASIEMSISTYKAMYYDRVIQDYQLAILLKPNDFNLTDFYCNALVNAVRKYITEEKEEINTMKRESAKAKRKAKVIEVIKSAKEELQNKCSSALSYSKALIEFEKFELTINTKV